jgi:hypothetical protein
MKNHLIALQFDLQPIHLKKILNLNALFYSISQVLKYLYFLNINSNMNYYHRHQKNVHFPLKKTKNYQFKFFKISLFILLLNFVFLN